MDMSKCIEKMIEFYEGYVRDIQHTIKVHAFARQIGLMEGLDADTQEVTEVAAIVHDMACPMCRDKYHSIGGVFQQREGGNVARQFLEELGYDKDKIDRVCYIVEHHHTFTDIDGTDYQIVIEADYLVNAFEMGLPKDGIEYVLENRFRTASGKKLLKTMYR